MNKYKKLVSNTLIFAIGSFGSKILLLLLTRLYTGNINPGDNSTKELLEQTANFLIPIITFSIADAVIRYGIDKNFDNRKVFTSACVTEAFGIGVLLLLSPLLNFLPYTEGYVVLLVIYCITSGFRQIASQFVRARGLVRLFAMDGILAETERQSPDQLQLCFCYMMDLLGIVTEKMPREYFHQIPGRK